MLELTDVGQEERAGARELRRKDGHGVRWVVDDLRQWSAEPV